MKLRPDHQDADLSIKVYDLRREPVMRDARNAINFAFWPRSYADVAAVLKVDHPLNAAFRQMVSYWEMVYGMARHGIVHAEYWVESHGEGILLYAKVAPFLAEIRAAGSPTALRNSEWVATQTEEGQRLFDRMRERVRQAVEARPATP